MSANVPPSPVPPWQRPVSSPLTQTLSDAGAIDLNCDTTYLDAANGATGDPFALTIANGNYKRQTKRIYVKAERVAQGTAVWNLAGTFTGLASLTFNEDGYSAVLEWDGSGWHLIGGNVGTNA